MAPGDVCHGSRCSLAGLGPVALEYRSCHWPGGSAGSPQCVRPMGYWFFPVPRPPYVCAVSWAAWLLFTAVPARFAVLRLRCPGPLGSCSPVCSLGVLCCVCGVLCWCCSFGTSLVFLWGGWWLGWWVSLGLLLLWGWWLGQGNPHGLWVRGPQFHRLRTSPTTTATCPTPHTLCFWRGTPRSWA